MDYKLLQLTNTNIGAVSVGSFIPFGVVTGRINCPYRLDGAISVANSGSDVVVIGTCGHYKITYNSSLELAAAGNLSLALVINGTVVYTTTITGVDGFNNISFAYEFKVKDNIPTNIQIQVGTSALVSGTANTIVEKVW